MGRACHLSVFNDAQTNSFSFLTNTHPFAVAKVGYVEITLIGIGPSSTVTVGLGIGTPGANGTCSTIYTVNARAGPTAQVVGTGQPGQLCATIFDVGSLSEAAVYTITVAHP